MNRLREVSSQLGSEIAGLERNLAALQGSLEGKAENSKQLGELIATTQANLDDTKAAKTAIDKLLPKPQKEAPPSSPAVAN